MKTTKRETASIKINVKLEPSVADGLRELADNEGRTICGYVRRVLSEHVHDELEYQAAIDKG